MTLEELISEYTDQVSGLREELMYAHDRAEYLTYREAIETYEDVIHDLKALKNLDVATVKRSVLIDFFRYFRDHGESYIGMTIEEFVDSYLKSINAT